MTKANRCSNCGAPLDELAAGSLCPRCLLKLAIDGRTRLPQGPVDPPLPSGPPEHIGSYRILETVGEGGMGIVYLAEQQQPLRRRVALKVVKLGMDTREVVRRFQAERQALALMDHPNIAQVYDAGATPDGRPYFAMEYVPGVPITEYCDQHRLSNRDRLGLFVEVCSAIQHAHQKGIIHRDLKPSNVLVMVQEDRPLPKVIDFGVAKATSRHLIDRTLFTEHGQLIGTPEYMSPEQAEMSGLDIDTRTDIYSLGVLLYELLVGGLPFDRTRLRQAGYAEIQRIIREEEPERPSARLSSLGASASQVAERRRTDLTTLTRELRGDLDWIALKAMDKDRTRRYPTVSDLAADVARYLEDQPVAARAPSVVYRTRKFVRRHRVAAVAGLCVGTAVLAGLVVSTVLYLRAETEARQNRTEADAFHALFLDLHEEKEDLPRYLPLAREALEFHRNSTARDDPGRFATTLETYLIQFVVFYHLTFDLLGMGWQPPGAVRSFWSDLDRELAETLLLLLARDDPRVWVYLRNNFEDGSVDRLIDENDSLWERVLREALRQQRARLPSAQEGVREAEEWLGDLLAKRGRTKAAAGENGPAELMLREAIELARTPNPADRYESSLAGLEQELARVLTRLGRYPEAETLLLSSYDFWRASKVFGTEVNNVHADLLALYKAWGRSDKARALEASRWSSENERRLREAIELERTREPADRKRLTALEQELARVLTRLGRYEEAETLLVTNLDFWTRRSPSFGEAFGVRKELIAMYKAWGRCN